MSPLHPGPYSNDRERQIHAILHTIITKHTHSFLELVEEECQRNLVAPITPSKRGLTATISPLLLFSLRAKDKLADAEEVAEEVARYAALSQFSSLGHDELGLVEEDEEVEDVVMTADFGELDIASKCLALHIAARLGTC